MPRKLADEELSMLLSAADCSHSALSCAAAVQEAMIYIADMDPWMAVAYGSTLGPVYWGDWSSGDPCALLRVLEKAGLA